ncbi:TraR/DksA family transcriptional regulator [bacterium]|nr:TraR/DksA family transcriptional regulator [bacterium]MBU1936798.1 TraR/DksA family transcriptional regulator [bacterium]
MTDKTKKKNPSTKNTLYSSEDKEFFQQLIMSKRAKLLEELGYLKESSETTLEEYSGDNSTYSFHMADQGTDAQEREKAFLFAHREGKFLAHLDRALERINDGTYGICAECGEPIAKARLEAVPHARMCVDCKKKLEEK